MKIDEIELKIIPDSRGQDTLEAKIISKGFSVSAAVPSGKSKGAREVFVVEPQKALGKFEKIRPQVLVGNFASVEEFDNFLISLDGTANKGNLGGNLILALSIAFTKLLAKSQNLEVYELLSHMTSENTELSRLKFPLCFFNVINGGLHAHSTALRASLPFQEYMFVPQFNKPSENLKSVTRFIKVLGEKIQAKYGKLQIGDEGGYEVPSKDPEEGLKILKEVMAVSGQTEGRLSLDVAASSFFHEGQYKIGEKVFTTDEMVDLYEQFTDEFSLLSIEDPFSEDDRIGFSKIYQKLKNKVWIIGDDLTVTNPSLIKKAHEEKTVTGVIIKPNQIGSVSETLEAIKLAQSYGWKIIVSHRSGETMDTFIADLAYGVGADGLKSGCPLQKERLVKYQRLVEIESRVESQESRQKGITGL